MLYQIIIAIHALFGFCIIGLVLMQHGKGADAGAAFGSGSSGSVFGAQGSASFLSRTTAIFAALFFTTSLTLAVLSGNQGKKTDIIESLSEQQQRLEKADVPSEATKPAASAELTTEKLPAAAAIKEVEQAAPAPAEAAPATEAPASEGK